MEQPNYYSIITSDVRYDKRLTPNAKLLYAEITALTNMNGKCFASNKYFSDLYGVDSRTISRWVSSLVNCGYIKIELGQDDRNQVVRYIQLCHGGIDKNVTTPPDKNVYHNNTNKLDNNNTLTESNNKRPTYEQVRDYCFERKNNVDALKWFDYYSANGWKVGRNTMKDWKAAVRTWERTSFSVPKTNDEPKYLVEVGKFYIDDSEKYSPGYSDLASKLSQEQRNEIGDWIFGKFEGQEIKLSFIRNILTKAINKQ